MCSLSLQDSNPQCYVFVITSFLFAAVNSLLGEQQSSDYSEPFFNDSSFSSRSKSIHSGRKEILMKQVLGNNSIVGGRRCNGTLIGLFLKNMVILKNWSQNLRNK